MLDEIEMMMVTMLINNVIPIFQVGGKPRETNFGQLPSSVILRLLTITLRVRYLLTVIISNPPITHSVMFQIIVFLKEIERIRLDALQSSHAEKKKNGNAYMHIYMFSLVLSENMPKTAKSLLK